jgi:senataxin
VDKKCSYESCLEFSGTDLESQLDQYKLNDSQRDAVISCVEASTYTHIPSVRLIWGPPGAGKTKTVSCGDATSLSAQEEANSCMRTDKCGCHASGILACSIN